MSKAWVIVAESARAKIFEQNTYLSPLKELQGFTHQEARMHETDLTSDLPGHAHDGKGPGRHALGSETSQKEVEALSFAKELSSHIEKARQSALFERLVLVAPPEFLGMLRKALPEVLHNMIDKEVPKNLVKHDAQDIHDHIT